VGALNGTAPRRTTSVMDFYLRSGMSESDFQQIEPYLMNPALQRHDQHQHRHRHGAGLHSRHWQQHGPASADLPAVQSAANVPSITWLVNALQNNHGRPRGGRPLHHGLFLPIRRRCVAVGHNNRGYRRVRFVFDCSSGTPLIVYRQDLTYLGWPLGKKLHDQLLAQNVK
jgi:hypothetical protein